MGSRTGMQELGDAWTNFQLDEEESGGLEVSSEEVGEAISEGTDMRYALIGRFLTDRPINFVAMKNTMAVGTLSPDPDPLASRPLLTKGYSWADPPCLARKPYLEAQVQLPPSSRRRDWHSSDAISRRGFI